MAFSERYHPYLVKIPSNLSGDIDIRLRMRFRSIKPSILLSHPDCENDRECSLLNNLPIFDMASIQETVFIKSIQ